MRKLNLFFLAIIIACFLVLPASPVHADVAPPPVPGIGGLEPTQFQKTNVLMTFERVEMEILDMPAEKDERGDRQYNRVSVNAWFVLHNQGNVEEKMQVVFPLENLNENSKEEKKTLPSYMNIEIIPDSFKASVNGVPAEVSNTTSKIPWAAFDVTFPVDQDVLIRISYQMENRGGSDYISNVEYILETGAGWKGPISKGYVILRFPYMVEDNILPGTTPGYTKMYNEIYWSFENLEPTHENNILISYVEPIIWKKIIDDQVRIKNNPSDTGAWRELAESYARIAHFKGSNLRDKKYDQKAIDTFKKAIQINPNSADLYVGFAQYYDWYDFSMGFNQAGELVPLLPEDSIIPLLEKALQIDPSNEEALNLLNQLRNNFGDFDFNQPPTFTPTITPTFTVTLTASIAPSVTPTIAATKKPSQTPEPSRTLLSIGQVSNTVEKSSASATVGFS